MGISSSATFIDVLREWEFLEASQLDQLSRNRLVAYADPRELARDLVLIQAKFPGFRANIL
jgi:hypothetical protein